MLLREFHICLEISEWVKLHSLVIKPKFLIHPTKPEHIRWQWSVFHSFSLKSSHNHIELEQPQCKNPLLCCPRVCCMELIPLNILFLTMIVAKAQFLWALFPACGTKRFLSAKKGKKKTRIAGDEEVAAVQQRGLAPHYPAQMDKQLSHAQPGSARAGAPLSHPSLPQNCSEPAEITLKCIPSSPAHTACMYSEFLTWYSHFSHQQILTGAWALRQLFKLILFLTIGILCVKLHKDKLMLWNNLKQEEKGEKTRQNLIIQVWAMYKSPKVVFACPFFPVQWGDAEENGNFI